MFSIAINPSIHEIHGSDRIRSHDIHTVASIPVNFVQLRDETAVPDSDVGRSRGKDNDLPASREHS